MADLERPTSGFLPTIKCSMCAQDIEISMMGDHVCRPREPSPPPEPQTKFYIKPYAPAPTNSTSSLKPSRALPPKVDTSAANRPFLPQGEMTPVSASPIHHQSPQTADRRSPFGRPAARGDSPVARADQPPTPESLALSQDSAYPYFPTNRPYPPSEPAPRFAKSDPKYAPVSPRTASAGGLMQRMNTIAPGPFDVKGRRTPSDSRPPPPLRQASADTPTEPLVRPATANPSSASGRSRHLTNGSISSTYANTLPRAPRTNGYGGFGTSPPTETKPVLDRSQTFPQERKFSMSPAPNMPPQPAMAPSENTSPTRPRPTGPDLSRTVAPPRTSVIRPRTAYGEAPPIPTNINLEAEFGAGNPYHASTESQSSSASTNSNGSKASSRSSPPTSTIQAPILGNPRRKPSDTSKIDSLMSDIQASMMEPPVREIPPNPPRQPQFARSLAPVQNLAPNLAPLESPMDPAIQNGRLSPLPPRSLSPAQRWGPPARIGPPEIPREIPREPSRTPSRRPTTAKGDCKGCGLAIKGKSISSADGRLTGRYHKACFVCTTCSEPFATATFYVIDDAPYCERHYHKLNGSVCTTCDRGIEGQYLESERGQKFHPPCLNCSDCRRNLRHDYFEMNGRVYCERDAFRRAQQQPQRFLGPPGAGTNRMERRTTRLMMM